MRKWLRLLFLALLPLGAVAAPGVPVTYELPKTSAAEETYLVTLAVVDAKNPDWIISTFVSGQPRTVKPGANTFTETWNGLDDNFMPVPPGEYAVKGIYSPAKKWPVDGEWHSITARWHSGVSPWLPKLTDPENWKKPVPFHGDPVNSPIRDVDVAPDGTAVFYYQYLENGRNSPMFDLNKPIDPDQFLRAYTSGGAGGGQCVATDGTTVWAVSTDGTPDLVYRPDGKPHGKDNAPHRRGGYLPGARVVAMAALRDEAAKKSFVYVLLRGKIVSEPVPGRPHPRRFESTTEFSNRVVAMAGEGGAILGEAELPRPQGMIARNGMLYVLYNEDNAWKVGSFALENGVPKQPLKMLFKVDSSITPFDLEQDSKGRFYLSDSAKNKVYQLNTSGKILRTYGKMAEQKGGSYDPETLMAPAKLATWTDKEGQCRVLIVENSGPNRVAEWSGENGKLLREFPTYQTKANNGYAIDPANPEHIYLSGHDEWLTRFKIDYAKGTWTVDAVWPNVESGQRRGLDKAVAVRTNGTLYLASEQSALVYRLSKDGKRFFKSAGVIRIPDGRNWKNYLWNDANGNGVVDDEELRPTTLPGWVMTYHGQRWLDDLSYVPLQQDGRDMWRLSPDGFDAHGNPIFKEWRKVLTDPILAARAKGSVPALEGGNEIDDRFSSDWMQTDGDLKGDLYVQARGGRNFSANFGAQYKISRYVPDGKGGFNLKWRVGRAIRIGNGDRGELEGGMRIFRPVNGILAVIDQSRSGVFLYTDEGMYIDTLFPPGEYRGEIGVYRQPGEFFAGTVYPNKNNGKIYYAAGKYTPFLYEIENWSLKENPVKPIAKITKKISISTAQIADPPELAISLRGGAGAARVAAVVPAFGGAELENGSMTGWESALPVSFASGKDRTVEVRCMYTPDTLFLRWHLRINAPFQPKPMPAPERVFTHDQEADTVGLFFQGDVNAPAKGSAAGRPGDVRIVFGVFQENGVAKPVAIGLYPDWKGPNARPQSYRTPVGEAKFAHVAPVAGAKLGYAVDADKKGVVIAAAIPRAAIPALGAPFSGALRTRINFDANFGGHNRFWWADTDGSANVETYDEPSEARFYPGSWAPVRFESAEGGVTPKNWLIAGPFGGPGAEKFVHDPRNKPEVQKFYDTAVYPPDNGVVDSAARFSGPMTEGYWGKPRPFGWTKAAVEDLDTRVQLGKGSQVWYGATWVHAPREMEIPVILYGHKMTYIRWSLNGTDISMPYKDYKDERPGFTRVRVERKITLKAGWNQFFFRAYCVGYAPFRIGLTLQGPQDFLWQLRTSGVPEKN